MIVIRPDQRARVGNVVATPRQAAAAAAGKPSPVSSATSPASTGPFGVPALDASNPLNDLFGNFVSPSPSPTGAEMPQDEIGAVSTLDVKKAALYGLLGAAALWLVFKFSK